MIYAGVQKNVGPAGMVVGIIREDLIRDDLTDLPIYLQYSTHAGAGSMYNTRTAGRSTAAARCSSISRASAVSRKCTSAISTRPRSSMTSWIPPRCSKGTVEPEFRSLMNIPFVTESAELDAEVVAATKAAGFDNLKGHKSVGGLRASIYNAMPKEGVEALVQFLKDFEANYNK